MRFAEQQDTKNNHTSIHFAIILYGDRQRKLDAKWK